MRIHDRRTLPFYTQPAAMTSVGRYARLLDALPRDITALTAVAHGLLIHEHLVSAYGVTLSDQARGSVHIRPVERLLERIVAHDPRPLGTPRVAAGRVAANCRHFTVLMVSMLRAHGTPARARCGFGGYFGTGTFEDHWVCEYWHAGQERWTLVDAQIDDRQRDLFPIDFDVTDVPRDRFLVAGEAWRRCRAGEADPRRFGLSLTGESGDWWIAGNLMRDAAALGNLELLPWDRWGAMPTPEEPIDGDRLALFDRLAALTLAPDTRFDELRGLCQDDDRLRVPQAVHNDLRGRDEAL
jgi:Transglutaminase-like superfamily